MGEGEGLLEYTMFTLYVYAFAVYFLASLEKTRDISQTRCEKGWECKKHESAEREREIKNYEP